MNSKLLPECTEISHPILARLELFHNPPPPLPKSPALLYCYKASSSYGCCCGDRSIVHRFKHLYKLLFIVVLLLSHFYLLLLYWVRLTPAALKYHIFLPPSEYFYVTLPYLFAPFKLCDPSDEQSVCVFSTAVSAALSDFFFFFFFFIVSCSDNLPCTLNVVVQRKRELETIKCNKSVTLTIYLSNKVLFYGSWEHIMPQTEYTFPFRGVLVFLMSVRLPGLMLGCQCGTEQMLWNSREHFHSMISFFPEALQGSYSFYWAAWSPVYSASLSLSL